MPKKQKNNSNRPALVRHMRNAPKHYVNKKGALDSNIDPTDIQERLAKFDEPETEEHTDTTLTTGLESAGVLSSKQRRLIHDAQSLHASQLRIPRRPSYHPATTREQLHASEDIEFHTWRGHINTLANLNNITLTPFEKNLDVWRELWRTLEKSDLIVQILDARNPLLFRCRDLESYVKEINPRKMNLLLVNKSDYLTEEQRVQWTEFFNKEGTYAVFFSALHSTKGGLHTTIDEDQEPKAAGTEEGEGDEEDDVRTRSTERLMEKLSQLDVVDSEDDQENSSTEVPEVNADETKESIASVDTEVIKEITYEIPEVNDDKTANTTFQTTSRLYNREELIELLTRVCPKSRGLGESSHVGMVGYPNVGKSSTINCLLRGKKVRVSATPGKTKSLQTHIMPDTSGYTHERVVLVDCPGLVFPGFATTKQEMILWGIFPIDRIRRDYHSPMTLLCHTLPASYLEAVYSLPTFPGLDTRPVTNDELLATYSVLRGFFSDRGRPDVFRAARVIMKDFMCGKLLSCVAPPGHDQAGYHQYRATKGKTFRLTPHQITFLPDSIAASLGAPQLGIMPLDAPLGMVPQAVGHGKGTRPSQRKARRRNGVMEEL